MRKLLIIIGCIAIAGCAVKESYVQPTSGSTATLTIRTEDDVNNLWIYNFKGSMDGYKCSTGNSVAIAILNNASIFKNYADNGKKTQTVTIKVPAGNNQPFRIGIPKPLGSYRTPSKPGYTTHQLCLAHAEFFPEEGGVYELVHSQCSIKTSSDVQLKTLPICYPLGTGYDVYEEAAKKKYVEQPELYR